MFERDPNISFEIQNSKSTSFPQKDIFQYALNDLKRITSILVSPQIHVDRFDAGTLTTPDDLTVDSPIHEHENINMIDLEDSRRTLMNNIEQDKYEKLLTVDSFSGRLTKRLNNAKLNI